MTTKDHNGDEQQPSRRHPQVRAPQALAGGRYELVEFVSKGGMGAIYRAHDTELDRTVAVKCLLDVSNRDARDRAVREAKTLASLNHPNIMRVYDILAQEDQVWIVSEWITGKSLASYQLPLPPAATSAIMAQVFAALSAAHQANVFHRDVKPSNIMLGADGRVSLIDFGVAYRGGASTGETMAGSFRYTDPRILEGQRPDAYSDLFSAALVTVELLSGEPPLPDMAPLPLYRYIKKNLNPAVESQLDGLYPPLANLVRRYAYQVVDDLAQDDYVATAALDAVKECKDILRQLSDATPDDYLGSHSEAELYQDKQARDTMVEQAKEVINDQQIDARLKSDWVAFRDALDDNTPSQKPAPIATTKRREHWSWRFAGTVLVAMAISMSAVYWVWTKPKPSSGTVVDAAIAPVTQLGENESDQSWQDADTATTQSAPPSTTTTLSTDSATVSEETAPQPAAPEVAAVQPESNRPVPTAPAAQQAPTPAPKPAPLFLVANAWADVIIDGEKLGRLPQATPFMVAPGKRKLQLESPIIETLTKEIVLKPGEELRLRLDLQPKVTPRVIKLAKPGRLFVDGVDHGIVTAKALPLSYGQHEVWIKRENKVIKPQNITVGPDSPMEIVIEEPQP